MPQRPEELLAHGAFVRRLVRGLVGDASSAEDVAQSALTAAVERGPDEPSRLRAWLASTARRIAAKERRGRSRRSERERAVARPEAVGSVAELVAREALRRRVIEALVALDEPYRSTLVLRFYDGLPPRRVAERMNAPVETVRTRTKRGLAMLRARLDRETEGGREAWCALLLPVALHPVPIVELARELALEVLGMSTKTKLAAAGVALTALALVVSRIALERGAPLEPVAAVDTVVPEPRSSERAPDEPSDAVRSGAVLEERRALAGAPPEHDPAAAIEPFGTIELLAVRDASGEPAPGTWVRVQPWSLPDWPFRAFDVQCDEEGRARIERVPAGRVGFEAFGGGLGNAELAPGETLAYTLELPRGCAVRGLVVDREGTPVADADVWVSGQGNLDSGRVMTRSDAQGRFDLPSVDGSPWIGARSTRFAPSLAPMLICAEGAEVELRLVLRGPCGRVEGRVVDPAGQPIAGALVRIGSGNEYRWMREDGAEGVEQPAFDALTDASGRFALEGLPLGVQPVAVRGEGFATWRGAVEIAEGRTSLLDVALGAGVTLAGYVRSADGMALSGVGVAVGPWGKLGHLTKTANDGSYLLEDLEPGDLRVAADGGDRGRAETTLQGAPAARLRWDPVLSTGFSLGGRLLAENGERLAGDWWVAIESLPGADGSTGEYHFDSKTPDAQGRFTFVNLSDREYSIAAHAPSSMFASLVVSPVRPGGGELELRVASERIPSVLLSGRLVDREGAPVGDAELVPSCAGVNQAPIEQPDPTTGAFELGPYPPGVWRLSVQLRDGARQRSAPALRLGPRALAAGERWELGAIEVGGAGSLLARFRRAAGVPDTPPILGLEYAGGGTQTALERDGDSVRAGPLAPGSYVLRVGGFDDFACARHPFEVRADEETVLDVELEPGSERAFRIEAARTESLGRFAELELRRADGELVLEMTFDRGESPTWERGLHLAPGSYRAEARIGDLRSAPISFSVDPTEADPQPITCRLP